MVPSTKGNLSAISSGSMSRVRMKAVMAAIDLLPLSGHPQEESVGVSGDGHGPSESSPGLCTMSQVLALHLR